MADKNLNSITFPGLPDKYKVAQVADEYSSSSTYAVGDIVNYLGTIYRCTTAIATAENWTAGHWTAVKIADEVTDLKSALNTTNEQFVEISGAVIPPNFVIGSRYVSDGVDTFNANVTARMSMQPNYYIELKQGDVVTIDTSVLKYFGGGYSTNNGASFTSITTQSGEYNVTVDGIYFFWLYKIGEAVFTQEDVKKAFKYIHFIRNGSMKEHLDEIYYTKASLENDYVEGWIRHGTGELVSSAATKCYVYKNTGISNVSVFTKSDTTVIDAVAFYSGDGISVDTYMSAASVAWKGEKRNGAWYDVAVPATAKTIAISVANATESYSPVIKVKTSESIVFSESLFASNEELTKELRKRNDIVLSDGWKYIYHFGMSGVAYRDVEIIIPSQSVFDVRNAHNLGYKCIEANVHKTYDGKYVVTHGLDGGLGHDFNDLNGDDAYGTSISENTFSNLRTNYRYRSTVEDYRTQITSLEEFLHEAKQYNMIVMVQYVDDIMLSIVKGIMGTRFFVYNAPRTAYDGPILWYGSLATKSEILAKCNQYGNPFIFSMGNASSFSDADLQDIINTLHQNGYYIATAYIEGETLTKYSKMGFDFFAVDRNYVTTPVILNGKQLVFNQDGSVSWTNISLV